MKIAYFPNQIALNSQTTLRYFLESAKILGFTPIENSFDADAAVIWSVLWNGKLQSNKSVYDHYRSQNKPVFILEVGTLRRGYTWKVALNDITTDGIYGNQTDLDPKRPGKIGKILKNPVTTRKSEILIACQHQKSHQWKGNPPTEEWIRSTISEIRKYSDRKILIRPHPRSMISKKIENTELIMPKKLVNTHDEYDIDYHYHCIVNYNSGPSVSAAIEGVPVICDQSSLAWPVSDSIKNIENLSLPDREDWFLKICHTEWTNEEIRDGLPIKRLISHLNR
jgi:hypothetical protein